MYKKIGMVFVLFLALLCLAGCEKDENGNGEYQIYYLNRDLTRIVPVGYDSSGTGGEALVQELIYRLRETPESSKLRQAIPEEVKLKGIKMDGAYLTLDFNSEYKKLSVTEEVLMRAAIVRTLLQVDGVSLISFTVEAEPLRTPDGMLIGNMSKDSFVENPGEQLAETTQSTVKLYFSSEDGTRLVEEVREINHSTSTSMEKLVIEQLIAGPQKDASKATIPSATKLINISVVDTICYLNLDGSFQNQDQGVKEEIVLYSIVNSLTELPGITKVQISINGNTKGYVRYTCELSQMYEKNTALLPEEEGMEGR